MPETTVILASEQPPAPGLREVFGVAYSGGAFTQPWEDKPLVLDLAGLAIAPQIPLLLSHENHPDCRLGVVEAAVVDGKLVVSGGVDDATEEGRRVCEAGKKAPWQLSIGARAIERELVPAGSPRVVNGRAVEDCVVIVRSALREVSVVAVGADPDTWMEVAAALNLKDDPGRAPHNDKEKDMDKHEETVAAKEQEAALATPAAIKEQEAALATPAAIEAARVEALAEALGDRPEIHAKALRLGWTAEQAQSVAAELKAAEAKLGPAAPNVVVKNDAAPGRDAISAALLLRHGVEEKRAGKPEALEAAEKLRGCGWVELVQMWAEAGGATFPRGLSAEQTVKAAFSTADAPALIGGFAAAEVRQGFELAAPVAPTLCAAADLNDFKPTQRVNLLAAADLPETPDGEEIHHAALTQDAGVNQLKTYANQLVIGRQMIVNDDLGEFARLAQHLGRVAAQKVDDVFFSRLLSNPQQPDGKALFHADHGNLTTGASSALSIDGLKKLLVKFAKQKNGAGRPVALAPRFLLVPPELYADAITLVNSDRLIGGGDKLAPANNPVAAMGLAVVTSPWLSDDSVAGASATAYYLLADPASAPVWEIGYLRGVRQPTVEAFATGADYLGTVWRVFFDFGIREQDYRGQAKAAGA